MSADASASYACAATMRRSMAMLQAEMQEFQIAAMAPVDRDALERARRAAHDYLDAFLDAMAAAHAGTGGHK